jgi:hypothetical protein
VIKVILLTPSPDLKVDMSEPENKLNQHANQIRQLADKYQAGFADSYMAQDNHPNEAGHLLIVDELVKWF